MIVPYSSQMCLRSWIDSDEILFRAVICNHRDNDDLNFTEGSVLFTLYVVSTDAFSYMGHSEANCIRWGLSFVGWWNE